MRIRRLSRPGRGDDDARRQDWDATAPPPVGPLVFRSELMTAGELSGDHLDSPEVEHPEAGTAA